MVNTLILKCCVDRSKLKSQKIEHLSENNELALSLINFIDGLKEQLEDLIGLILSLLRNEAVPPVVDAEDGRIEYQCEGRKQQFQ